MCRIALLQNVPAEVAQTVSELQVNGGNRRALIWSRGRAQFIFNRFDVTTSELPNEAFPMRGRFFEVAYNGEVFGFRGQRFSGSRHPSDVHFALHLLETAGLEAFLKSADLQGTFVIHELQSGDVYILADQFNTQGAFYSIAGTSFIFAQEVAIVEAALKAIGAASNTTIHPVPNGHYLRLNVSHEVVRPQIHSIRRFGARLFEGRDASVENFWAQCDALQTSLVEATIRRIPTGGPVAVLCGGGVDSSCLLTIVARRLSELGQLDRLVVGCFGAEANESRGESDDLLNTRLLLSKLGISQDHLVVANEDLPTRRWLYDNSVFCDLPRLITPNPVLHTQVRHTVRMSVVLAEIVRAKPDVRVVLTGDCADEIFAGYHSMRIDVKSAQELADRVRMKVEDLPLNDASRFTLASLIGMSAVLRELVVIPALVNRGLTSFYRKELCQEEIQQSIKDAGVMTADIAEALRRLHPVEIRTPFSSHEVLLDLQGAHPDFLVGEFDGHVVPKFLLRVAAYRLGVPAEIAVRPKVPFNEGGGGVRNDQTDPIEVEAARAWQQFGEAEARAIVSGEHLSVLRRLNLMSSFADNVNDMEVAMQGFEQVALYWAARNAGLDRLLNGGTTFRAWMPDCVYSTEETPGAYTPRNLLSFSSGADRLTEGRTIL
jgi:asparagine synthetase B (glutamine-hydrolysing)